MSSDLTTRVNKIIEDFEDNLPLSDEKKYQQMLEQANETDILFIPESEIATYFGLSENDIDYLQNHIVSKLYAIYLYNQLGEKENPPKEKKEKEGKKREKKEKEIKEIREILSSEIADISLERAKELVKTFTQGLTRNEDKEYTDIEEKIYDIDDKDELKSLIETVSRYFGTTPESFGLLSKPIRYNLLAIYQYKKNKNLLNPSGEGVGTTAVKSKLGSKNFDFKKYLKTEINWDDYKTLEEQINQFYKFLQLTPEEKEYADNYATQCWDDLIKDDIFVREFMSEFRMPNFSVLSLVNQKTLMSIFKYDILARYPDKTFVNETITSITNFLEKFTKDDIIDEKRSWYYAIFNQSSDEMEDNLPPLLNEHMDTISYIGNMPSDELAKMLMDMIQAELSYVQKDDYNEYLVGLKGGGIPNELYKNASEYFFDFDLGNLDEDEAITYLATYKVIENERKLLDKSRALWSYMFNCLYEKYGIDEKKLSSHLYRTYESATNKYIGKQITLEQLTTLLAKIKPLYNEDEMTILSNTSELKVIISKFHPIEFDRISTDDSTLYLIECILHAFSESLPGIEGEYKKLMWKKTNKPKFYKVWEDYVNNIFKRYGIDEKERESKIYTFYKLGHHDELIEGKYNELLMTAFDYTWKYIESPIKVDSYFYTSADRFIMGKIETNFKARFDAMGGEKFIHEILVDAFEEILSEFVKLTDINNILLTTEFIRIKLGIFAKIKARRARIAERKKAMKAKLDEVKKSARKITEESILKVADSLSFLFDIPSTFTKDEVIKYTNEFMNALSVLNRLYLSGENMKKHLLMSSLPKIRFILQHTKELGLTLMPKDLILSELQDIDKTILIFAVINMGVIIFSEKTKSGTVPDINIIFQYYFNNNQIVERLNRAYEAYKQAGGLYIHKHTPRVIQLTDCSNEIDTVSLESVREIKDLISFEINNPNSKVKPIWCFSRSSLFKSWTFNEGYNDGDCKFALNWLPHPQYPEDRKRDRLVEEYIPGTCKKFYAIQGEFKLFISEDDKKKIEANPKYNFWKVVPLKTVRMGKSEHTISEYNREKEQIYTVKHPKIRFVPKISNE